MKIFSSFSLMIFLSPIFTLADINHPDVHVEVEDYWTSHDAYNYQNRPIDTSGWSQFPRKVNPCIREDEKEDLYMDEEVLNYRYPQNVNDKPDSDYAIGKRVNDTLLWLEKTYPSIHFEVKKGIVTLKGSLESQKNRDKIEQVIRKIEGVKDVNNQLEVMTKPISAEK